MQVTLLKHINKYYKYYNTIYNTYFIIFITKYQMTFFCSKMVVWGFSLPEVANSSKHSPKITQGTTYKLRVSKNVAKNNACDGICNDYDENSKSKEAPLEINQLSLRTQNINELSFPASSPLITASSNIYHFSPAKATLSTLGTYNTSR